MHGVIHTSIVCVYEFRRGFCTSVLSLYIVSFGNPFFLVPIYSFFPMFSENGYVKLQARTYAKLYMIRHDLCPSPCPWTTLTDTHVWTTTHDQVRMSTKPRETGL